MTESTARLPKEKAKNKQFPIMAVGAALVIALILGGLTIAVYRSKVEKSTVPKVAGCNGTVGLNEFSLEEATDGAAQAKGLGGRTNLPEKCGMLFTFDRTARHGIWMKDMKFNLDILWLDQNKRIVSIRENAPYNSYPEVYTPNAPAKYVIELNAGQSRAGAFRVGQTLTFDAQPAAKVNYR